MTDPSPEQVVAAFYAAFEYFGERVEGARLHRSANAMSGVTGVPVPTLNGVWSGSTALRPDEVAGLLDAVVPAGLPYCLQFPEAGDPALAELAESRGMRRDEDVPLMLLPTKPAAEVPRLAIRQLDDSDIELHATVAAEAFDAPIEVFHQLISPGLVASPGVRVYVGEVDGVPVTTGLGLTLGDAVAVFDIGTPERFRGNGYAAALTARVVEDGLAAGGRWAWLQSSEAGLHVYQRLGFRAVDTWQCWISA